MNIYMDLLSTRVGFPKSQKTVFQAISPWTNFEETICVFEESGHIANAHL